MNQKTYKLLLIIIVSIVSFAACSIEKDRLIFTDTYVPNNFTADCIDLNLDIPNSIKTGEGFTNQLVISNTCDEAITVEYGAGGDFLITQTNGKVIWQRYQGGVTPTVLFSKILASGESFSELQVIWDGKDSQNELLQSGTYQAVYIFNYLSGNLETVKTFEILD